MSTNERDVNFDRLDGPSIFNGGTGPTWLPGATSSPNLDVPGSTGPFIVGPTAAFGTSLTYSNVIAVYDRWDENSLVTAAVLKHLLGIRVIEDEKIGMLNIFKNPNIYDDVLWLGDQPRPSQIKHFISTRHTAYVPKGCNEKKSDKSVRIITDNDSSLLKLVLENCEYINIPRDSRFSAELWSNLGETISQFSKKTSTKELLCKCYQILHNAYQFLYLGEEFDPYTDVRIEDIGIDEFAYQRLVKHSKYLLETHSNVVYIKRDERPVPIFTVNVSDFHWFAVKRMLILTKSVWAVPVITHRHNAYAVNVEPVTEEKFTRGG